MDWDQFNNYLHVSTLIHNQNNNCELIVYLHVDNFPLIKQHVIHQAVYEI